MDTGATSKQQTTGMYIAPGESVETELVMPDDILEARPPISVLRMWHDYGDQRHVENSYLRFDYDL